MRWLLKKDDLGYVLYEENQIEKRLKRKGAYSSKVDYEFCVSYEELALTLLERQARRHNDTIALLCDGLSQEAEQRANQIIMEHNHQT